jgi:hypothetical protein
MTLEQLTHLIAIHGGERANWPQESREQALPLLDSSAAARALLEQQQAVDALLDQLPLPKFDGLEARILNQTLPPRQRSSLERFVSWLLPDRGLTLQWWRPAAAACLPLVFGVLVGNYFSFGVANEDDGFHYWEDELTMLSLTNYAESQL